MSISVVLLTYNSETVIEATLRSASKVSDDLHVVDSFSTDRTLSIAKAGGARVVQHPFENYGAQRNWAIENLPLKYDWELHLDADERLSDELAQEIFTVLPRAPRDIVGYFIPRLVCFMGRPIRHGGMFPVFHLRLFRRGFGRCEDRFYDQHFFVRGRTQQLRHHFVDDIRMSLDEYVTRHNRWAAAEMREQLTCLKSGRICPAMFGDPAQRKRFLRAWYERFPLFARAVMLFLYRYVFRLGFLDGKEGLIFYVIQTFWFRFLVDARLFEYRLGRIHGDT